MKKCPQCTRLYDDVTLNFCLDDGIVLRPVETASFNDSIDRQTEEQTKILPNESVLQALKTEQYSQKVTDENIVERETLVRNVPINASSNQITARSGVSPIFAYLTVGLVGVLVVFGGVAVFVWFSSGAQNNKTASESNKVNVTSESGEANLNLQVPAAPLSKTPGETKAAATPPKSADTEQTKPPEPTESPKADPPAEKSSGKYFVIIGSFPLSQSAQAQQRLQNAQGKGLNARIINTNDFPGLRSGLLAVVAGPYSKAEARNAVSTAKSVSADAYIKAGY